jgi:hypothetical protein
VSAPEQHTRSSNLQLEGGLRKKKVRLVDHSWAGSMGIARDAWFQVGGAKKRTAGEIDGSAMGQEAIFAIRSL